MIYLFTGDNNKSLEKASALFKSLQEKKPDASFASFDAESISLPDIEAMIASQGLFEKKIVAYLRNVYENKELKKELQKRLQHIKASENIFVWVEKELTDKEEKELVAASEKHLASKGVEVATKEFNTFTLSDAFGNRDKLKLWTLLLDALEAGKAAEEIQGVLFWQAKSIALAKSEKTAEAAGMKSFSFSKARQFAAKFKEEEINFFVKRLVEMYHDAHLGRVDFTLALEDFALSI